MTLNFISQEVSRFTDDAGCERIVDYWHLDNVPKPTGIVIRERVEGFPDHTVFITHCELKKILENIE